MQKLKNSSAEIKWTASQSVKQVVASLGRTEDICFSPSDRRLAVAAYGRRRITIFNISIESSSDGPQVALTGAINLSSAILKSPHGLAFIDDETLIVADRQGDVVIFKLPGYETYATDVSTTEILPVQTLIADGTQLVQSPGSVAIMSAGSELSEVLICNNYINTVSKHLLDASAGYACKSSEVLLQKWIYIPDSVTISADRRWIAVSNHEIHSVMVYGYGSSLGPQNDPDSVLCGVEYPHGLRFSSDGRYLFVADAGAPFLHVFASQDGTWRGVHKPAVTIRAMNEAEFLRGRYNSQEGGPKGLAIDASMNVLVLTSEYQPLEFFNLSAIIEQAAASSSSPNCQLNGSALEQKFDAQTDIHCDKLSHRAQQDLEISRVLGNLLIARVAEAELKARRAEEAVDVMKSSKSWRITAPIRCLHSALQKFK